MTTRFEKYVDGRQLVWDASSLSTFRRCPRLYKYGILDKYELDRPRGAATSWGTCWHEGIEAYETEIVMGLPPIEAVKEGMVAAARKWEEMGAEPSSNRNLDTLLRAIVWYYLQYKDEVLKTVLLPNGYPALEARFERAIPNSTYRFSGRLDRIVEIDGGMYPMDHKTTTQTVNSYYFNQYNPDIQMQAYVWGLRALYGNQVRGVLVNACQTAVHFSRYMRHLITFTETQMEEFEYELNLSVDAANAMRDNNYYPRNEASCGMYGGCQFRRVCSVSPEYRADVLEEEFRIRER